MNFPLRDLNSSPYPPHPTSTCICGVIIISRMYGGMVLTYWELSHPCFFPTSYFKPMISRDPSNGNLHTGYDI